MAVRIYAGEWLTSRVALLEGETVTSQSFAYRRGVLGGWAAGVLYLTTSRLLFTPMWFSLGIGRRAFKSEDIDGVVLEKAGKGAFPNIWTMKLRLGSKTEQFGFGGLPTNRQRTVAESWVEAVKQWAKNQ